MRKACSQPLGFSAAYTIVAIEGGPAGCTCTTSRARQVFSAQRPLARRDLSGVCGSGHQGGHVLTYLSGGLAGAAICFT